MAAASFLQSDALKTVWCAPNQNRTIITAPAKISGQYGTTYSVRVMMQVYPLPTQAAGDYYFVYQIGPAPAVLFNLLGIPKNVWTSCADICTSESMVMYIYNENGIRACLSQCYLRFNSDGNLVLAVLVNDSIPTFFETQALHFQMNSNAYFDSMYWTNAKNNAGLPLAPAIQYASITLQTNSDLSGFFNQVNSMIQATVPSAGLIISRNGRYYNSLSQLNTAVIGDTIEVLVDASVKSTYVLPLPEMPSFTSVLDAGVVKRAFMADTNYSVIDFKDDVDFFMISQTNSTEPNGLYFNQDNSNCVRMLTHNAYALQNTLLQNMLANDTVFHQETDVSIQAVVRHSGTERVVGTVASRIADLYKMSLADMLGAIASVNALIPEWQAANLENSPYTAIMGEWDSQVTADQVELALGYDALTSEYANPYPNFGQELAGLKEDSYTLPEGIYQALATTYDQNGKLLSFESGTPDPIQVVPQPIATAALVELVPGRLYGASEAAHYMGCMIVNVPLPLTQTGFRAYVTPIDNNGNPTNQWLDVTANAQGLFSLSANDLTLTWNTTLLTTENYYPLVVVGDIALMYQIPFGTVYPGYMSFSLQCNQWYVPAKLSATNPPVFQANVVAPIPFRSMDIFMDGQSLIEGIDYVVNWPTIVISKQPSEAVGIAPTIYVRCYGLPDFNSTTNSFVRNTPTETGFVVNGLISMDSNYRIRHERNQRVVVGGAVLSPSVSLFAEDNIAPTLSSPLNGAPYSVMDIVMPVEFFTDQTTTPFRAVDQSIDTRVSQYLTGKVSKSQPLAINPILDKYNLYSPFLSAIITGFIDGTFLNQGQLNAAYTNLNVASWLTPFMFLIPFDPTQNSNLNPSYVYVRPHPYPQVVVVTQVQYEFLLTVIRDYLSANAGIVIDLSSYIQISG